MLKILHPFSGLVALLTVATFWSTTVTVELFGSPAAVVAVKTAIPWGFLLLVPALVTVGGSSFTLARRRRGGLIGAKAGRMPLIAACGILILMPSALFLAAKARTGELDAVFYGVQTLELAAGALNLTLLGLSMRDGLKVKGRLRRTRLAPSLPA